MEIQPVIGLGIPIPLSRTIRVPVMVHVRPFSPPALRARNSPSNIALFLWKLSWTVEAAWLRWACTFVRESPTRIRPTVPQKLHGSADCLPFTDVLSFVTWAEVLSTSNPARNAATALPARLVAVGNYLGPLGRCKEKAGLTNPHNPEFRRTFVTLRRP